MLQENLKTKKERKVEMLGAHYYLWYGRPMVPIIGGGVWRSGYTNYPILGEYNSRDQTVIAKHIKWAKDAGINFFSIEWTGISTWDDITLKNHYLLNQKSSEIKFCLHYDSSLTLNLFGNPLSYDLDNKYSATQTKGEKLLEDFEYLANTYFDHPQYLKINDRPVIMIYNAYAFRNNSKYFEQLKINMEKKNISLFLIADVICWPGVRLTKRNFSYLWKKSPKEVAKLFYQMMRRFSLKKYEDDISLSKYFNAITGYNMFSVNRTSNFLKNVNKVYQKFYDYSHLHNLYFIPTVMPGYDDRKLKGLDRPYLEREKGDFYKEYWRVIKKYIDPSLKMALITTFNEWHEGTEIEPSKKHGTDYLNLTKSFSTN